jgi:hypothetical protein
MARHTLGDLIEPAEADTVQLVSGEARTIAKIPAEQQTRAGLGLGDSENPLQAEGFLYGEFYDNDGSTDSDGNQITNAVLIAEVTTKGGNRPEKLKDNELFRYDLSQIDDPSDRKEFKHKFAKTVRNNKQYWVGYPYEIRFKVEMKSGQTEVHNPDDTQNALEVDGRYQEK